MSATVESHYPSTGDIDLPALAGGQDLVLAVLTGARKRYKRRSTQNAYLDSHGAVCAIGAVVREVGVTHKAYLYSGWDPSATESLAKQLVQFEIDKDMRKAAQKAIDLLNRSAKKLYPEESQDVQSYWSGESKWSGPLETLNQELAPRAYRKAVLACYDHAIATYAAKVAK